ncbi:MULTISPECIES: site-specific integrase [Corynebacterium]|uniref:site-specific integrase n=1 Tax=Corynebacterium TaxID=1716 RepID=UPI00195AC36E|nr:MULTISPECIES: site-specific integrase [Corynebacterium]MDN8623721.1 tyrosine-type recombinase/integrase [Corynebacterium kroppenstedtii]QRQ64442.1 tyrosine-type recombinase/integrase [Corynebacterium kroppenstedtii]
MASIKQYNTTNGPKWRIQYRSPDGKLRGKRGFATKWQAENWAAENTVDLTTGQWRDPAGANITVETLSKTWWRGRQHLKPSTLDREASRLRSTVLPVWGKRKISTLRKSEIQAWVSASTLSGSSIRHAHNLLAQILDVAVDDNYLKSNPARGVKLPPKGKPVKVYLTPTQLERLAHHAGDKAVVVWVLGTVGLRWGELVGLKVEDVDEVHSRLRINRSVIYIKGKPQETLPKTHERRTVSVSLPVMRVIHEQATGRLPSAWLFPHTDGGPLKRPDFSEGWFAAAAKKAQAEDPSFPRITPHGLRHVAAGLLVSAGANVKVVQRQLGHASAVLTLDTYADLFEGDLDSAGQAMAGLFSNVVKM